MRDRVVICDLEKRAILAVRSWFFDYSCVCAFFFFFSKTAREKNYGGVANGRRENEK